MLLCERFNRGFKSRAALIFVALLVALLAHQVQSSTLPPLKTHPLPPSLAQWKTVATVGDYFSQVEESPLGYLVWSEFPVKVYLDASEKDGKWEEAVMTAVTEWSVYLPLARVIDRSLANIIIIPSSPPVNMRRNPETGLMEFSRARSARTFYQFAREENKLIHQMTIEITPNQSKIHTLATARHEIGHALGIWGHSPNINDALYFSQVRDSPKISPRDVNTLKKVYQQKTRLGWEIKHKVGL